MVGWYLNEVTTAAFQMHTIASLLNHPTVWRYSLHYGLHHEVTREKKRQVSLRSCEFYRHENALSWRSLNRLMAWKPRQWCRWPPPPRLDNWGLHIIIDDETSKCLGVPPSVRTINSITKEPTTNFGFLYFWGSVWPIGPLVPRDLRIPLGLADFRISEKSIGLQ